MILIFVKFGKDRAQVNNVQKPLLLSSVWIIIYVGESMYEFKLMRQV